MKKLLLCLVMVVVGLVSFTAQSQTLTFKTEAYSQRELLRNGFWDSWSRWESCHVLVNINLDSDYITIYSNRHQFYKIYHYVSTYVENGAKCSDYLFVDQDGDYGKLSLVVKPSGQSEIYIRFSNVEWAYIVKRL